MIRKNKKDRETTVFLRLSKRDKKRMKLLALKYSNGNLSQWVKYTSLHYKPTKKEMANA